MRLLTAWNSGKRDEDTFQLCAHRRQSFSWSTVQSAPCSQPSDSQTAWRICAAASSIEAASRRTGSAMRAIRRFLIRLAAAVSGRRDEQRLLDEVEEHLAMHAADYIRAGVPPREARRLAVLKFGAVESIKERQRDEHGLPFIDQARQDVRYALRQLGRSPLFTLTASLSLAVGIGATAAVFTLVDRILLRSLPVDRPHELVVVKDQRSPQEPSPRFSYPFYTVLKDATTLNGMTARFALALNANLNGEPTRVRGELVSGNYFAVIGAGTSIGRAFTAQDDRTPGAHPVAVISEGLWRREFGSDPSVAGRTVGVNDTIFTIVGVAAKGFTGTDVGSPTDLWVPMMMQREVGRDLLTNAETNWIEIIGRLRPGVSAERAAAELSQFVERAQALQALPLRAESRRIVLAPGGKGSSGLRREIGPALRVLSALTLLALILTSVNVAGLLAVRSEARQKEIAVKLALGARRGRLAWQFATETLLLALLGGTAGLLVAPWAAGFLAAAQPDRLGIDPGLDFRVFAFGLAMSVVTGLCVSQAPILACRKITFPHASGSPPKTAPGAHRRFSTHDVIVTCQMAASLAMLISAALLIQSLKGLSSVDPGFRAGGLLLMSADPAAAGYDNVRLERYWRDALDRVSRINGVETASVGRVVPLAPGRQRQPLYDPTSDTFVEIDTNFVGPRYFRTLGIPIVRGREFDERDGKTSAPVVIVNERLARMLWPGEEAIGKRIRMARDRQELQRKGPLDPPVVPLPEVVAVVKDAKYRDLRGEAGPVLYRPVFQSGSSDAVTLHVRAAGDGRALADAIRREVQSLDAAVPVFAIRTLDDELNASFAQTRQAAVLTGGFAVLALLLSGIGVYGVTALAVSRRTRDIGIRMALGAQRLDIVRLIGRRGFTLLVLGLGLGLAGSLAFTRIAESLLFGVTAGDSTTFAGMSIVLAVVCLTAIYIPARAATRLDAVTAIRHE
jgi:putative ABC transport system permease protein